MVPHGLPEDFHRRDTLVGNVASCRTQPPVARMVRTHQDQLASTLIYLVGSVDETEEIVRETFVRASGRVSRFRGRESFDVWLYRIARGIWRTRQDANRTANDPVANWLPDDVSRVLWDAMQELSLDDRELVLLRDRDRYDYATIASLVDSNVPDIRRRLYSARRKLEQAVRRRRTEREGWREG